VVEISANLKDCFVDAAQFSDLVEEALYDLKFNNFPHHLFNATCVHSCVIEDFATFDISILLFSSPWDTWVRTYDTFHETLKKILNASVFDDNAPFLNPPLSCCVGNHPHIA